MQNPSRSALSRAFRRVEAISDRELLLLTGAFLWLFSGIATLVAGVINPDLVPDPVVAWRIGCAVLASFIAISLFTWMPRLDDRRLMRWVYFWCGIAALIHAVLMLGQPLNISSLYIGLIAPVLFVACFLSAKAGAVQMVLITVCLLIPAAIGYTEVPAEHVLSRTVAYTPILWAVAISVFLMQANRKRALRHVDTVAGTDPLTGVANLHRFEQRGTELLDPRNARIAEPTAVLVIDLDDFKSINTNFGHAGGDIALREVGAALNAAVLPGQLVARIGGDEFAVLVDGAKAEKLEELVSHYAAAIANVQSSELLDSSYVRATIGVAISPDDGLTLDQLTEAADRSMYAKKVQGCTAKPNPVRSAAAAKRPDLQSPELAHPESRSALAAHWDSRTLYSKLAALGWLTAATIGLVALAMPDAVRGDLPVTLTAVGLGYAVALAAWFTQRPSAPWQWVRNDLIALLWIGWVAYLTGGAYSALWPLVSLFIAFEAWVLNSRQIWSRVPGAIVVVLAPLAYSDFGSISKPTGASLYAGVLGILGTTLVLSFLQDNRERAERESKRLSTIDPRTSLLNRREFERRADALMQDATFAGSQQVAIAMLDLDHFKDVNTDHGHATGDELLATIGAALGGCTREEDSLARIGGDEFAVLLVDVDRARAENLTERYVQAIDDAVAGSPLAACRAVSATAGVAMLGADGSTLDQLLVCADRTLMARKALRDGSTPAGVVG